MRLHFKFKGCAVFLRDSGFVQPTARHKSEFYTPILIRLVSLTDVKKLNFVFAHKLVVRCFQLSSVTFSALYQELHVLCRESFSYFIV